MYVWVQKVTIWQFKWQMTHTNKISMAKIQYELAKSQCEFLNNDYDQILSFNLVISLTNHSHVNIKCIIVTSVLFNTIVSS